MLAAAPPAAASAPAMPSHSACQAPAARSCSCTRLPVSRSGGGLRAPRAGEGQDRPDRIRLCGMVEDPPRPAPAGSRTSPTSVWAISTTSSAIFAERARRAVASADPRAATRTREVCQGSAGSARPRSPATPRRRRARARRGLRACRPHRRAGLPADPRRRGRAAAPRARRRATSPPSGRTWSAGLLQQRARDHRRLRCASASSAQAPVTAATSASTSCEGAAWRRASPRCRRRPGSSRRDARTPPRLHRRRRGARARAARPDCPTPRPSARCGRRRTARPGRRRRSPRPPRRESRRARPRPLRARARSRASPAATRGRTTSSSNGCGREDRVEHQQTFYTFSSPT